MLNSHSTFKFLDSSRVVLNSPHLSYNVSWSSFLLDHLSEISCFSFLIPLSYLVSDWMTLTNRVFHFCSHGQSYVLWLTILSISTLTNITQSQESENCQKQRGWSSLRIWCTGFTCT